MSQTQRHGLVAL